jgi:hypothetical protein
VELLLQYSESLQVFSDEPKPKREKRTFSKSVAGTVVASGSSKYPSDEDFQLLYLYVI